MYTDTTQMAQYEVLIGLDWADDHHDLCVHVKGEKEHRFMRCSSDAVELHECFTKLHAETGGGRIAVCLEQKRGPVVYALMMHQFIDLYPVNPLQVAKYRAAFTPSGAKDDPGDAALMLDLLCRHGEKVKCWKPDSPEVRKLQLLCEARRRFVDQRADCANELRAVLKFYYPQALTIAGGNLASEMFCAFLMKWPRFEKLAAAQDDTVRRFLYAHNIRNSGRIERALEIKNQSTVLTSDEAVVEAQALRVQALVRLIREHNRTEKEYSATIRKLEASMQDARLFQSLPGAGAQLAPRLLAAFGSDRSRFSSAEEVSTYMGIAPVIERSGKKSWIHWRWSCPAFLRQTLVEFARTSIGQSEWASAYYHKLRKDKNKGHNAAVRALAFKWVRIIFRCWQDNSLYSEERYVASLKTKGSPLVQAL